MAFTGAILVLTSILITAYGLEGDVKYELGKQVIAMDALKRDIMEMKQKEAASMSREAQLRAQVTALQNQGKALSESVSSLERQVKSNTQETTQLKQDVADRALKDSNAAAFTAIPSSQISSPTKGSAMKFDNVLYMTTRAFDSSTGKFTAPIRGLYAFQFKVLAGCFSEKCKCALYVNGKQKVDQFFNSKNAIASLSSVWELQQGEQVELRWIEGIGQVISLGGTHTVFSGYLVKAL